MTVDQLLALLNKYTKWDGDTEDDLPIEWDIDFFANSIKDLRILESKTPIQGFSDPPYQHSSSQDYPDVWHMRNELIFELNTVIKSPDWNTPQNKHLRPSFIPDCKKMAVGFEKIKEEGIRFHMDRRGGSVIAIEETMTEYVSDCNIEFILHCFCRSDTKNTPHFCEFISTSGNGYDAKMKKQSGGVKHIVVSIGKNLNVDQNVLVEIVGKVRHLIGLTSKLEDWEVQLESGHISVPLFERIYSDENWDEVTLGKRLAPKHGWNP